MGIVGKIELLSSRKAFLKFIFTFLLLVFPFSIQAADLDLEKDLYQGLAKSKSVVETIQNKMNSNSAVSVEIAQMKTLLEAVKADHLLLQERFKARGAQVKAIGSKAADRQRAVSESYDAAMTEYLSLMESLTSGNKIAKSTINSLKTILDKLVLPRKKPAIGSLPYTNLNYPAREPAATPVITPAYRGGDQTTNSNDLAGTIEAPISATTVSLAQSLGWNPVLIYEYVKNNIETEWYWGCMKGAEETLRQKSGNDCDQAALLTALLRASNFPTRYVRGTIEFFPDIQIAKNLTGIDDQRKIAEFFQKAGIPLRTVLDGTVIKNIRIEHIWVETFVPYSNYRGAVMDDQGKIWLGLDTSIKASGYTYNTAADIMSEYTPTTLRDDYLSAVRTETPLEYLRATINDYLLVSKPGATYTDYLASKTLVPEVMQILPASMQFTQDWITNEYSAIPDELRHQATFIAADASGKELFSAKLDTLALSNQAITMSYEPETVEDQELIDSYGGLDNTPSYLVRLRPVLKINNERMIVGKDGLAMGADFMLSVQLTSPNGVQEVNTSLITGNLVSINLSAQKTVTIAALPDDERSAGRILFEEGTKYINQWNQAEDELSSFLRVAIARPIPSMVIVGGVADVTYLLDTPHGYALKGVYIDADLRRIEAVQRSEFGVQSERQKLFMQLSSLQGSILENKIFEDDFQVGSISTAKLMQLVNQGSGGMGQGSGLITIDTTNIATVLPTLAFDQNIKDDIVASVGQELIVRIPQSEMTYENWTGIGYLKENPATGESGWMLSGSIAGGMTAWSFDRWPAYYADRLTNPYSEPSIYDPASKYFIDKVTATDMQMGDAGDTITLQVLVHKDTMQPVQNVPITFMVKAGGGTFSNMATSITISTNAAGIAKANLTLGKRTDINPTQLHSTGDRYNQQVGENIVDASLPSGTKLAVPFTAYGLPGPATALRTLHGGSVTTMILSSSGAIVVSAEDQYGNPISNRPVIFNAGQASSSDNCGNAPDTAYFADITNPCISNGATLSSCSDVSSQMTITTSIDGAAVQVLLGRMPDADYPISAASGTLPVLNFNHHSLAFGNCGADSMDAPQLNIVILPIEWMDTNGNKIMAGKSGTSIPVSAKIYFLKEAEKLKDETLMCTEPLTCPKIIGARTYSTETDVVNTAVTFNGQAGHHDENNKFTSDYTLQPGLNNITVFAAGSLGVYRTFNTCAGCMPPNTFFRIPGNISTTMQVYGVDITTPSVQPILVDSAGYTLNDTAITYTVAPLDYHALSTELYLYKNGTLIATIPSGLQSTGTITTTLTRGFQFDVNSAYEAEVVLNYGSSFEMRSGRVRIPRLSAQLEFDGVNTWGDGGKLLRVNSGDINTNGVPDYADGMDLYNNQGAGASAVYSSMTLAISGSEDMSQTRVRFIYSESDPSLMTRTGSADSYVYTPAPGSLRVWMKNGNESRRVASIKSNGDYIKAGEEYSLADLGITPANKAVHLYAEGIAPSTVLADQRIRVELDTDGAGPQPYIRGPEVKAIVDASMLIPDYNHNRTIDDEDKIRATRGDTFYFWVNDDDDSGDTGGSDIPGDTSKIDAPECFGSNVANPVPGCDTFGNASSATVSGVRDLVDFFPVYLNIKELLTTFDPGAYTYKLKSEQNSLRFAFTDLKPETAGDYLTGSANSLEPATTLGHATTYEILKSGVSINALDKGPAFLQGIKDAGTGILLFEGRKESTAPLVLSIVNKQNNSEVYSVSLKLSIAGVEQMFRQKNLIHDGGGPDAQHGTLGGEPNRVDVPANLPDSESNGKNIVFVHGYNVNGQQARGWQSEMFKRLYWSGSKAKFWGITWYGSDTQDLLQKFTRNYHINVQHAFVTAPKLWDFLKNIVPGEITIAAHSLGNMVVSAMLTDNVDSPNQMIKNFFMIDAAVAMEAYDDAITKDPNMHHLAWNGYDEFLKASEWYQLFTADVPADNRSKLTWRARFGNRPTGTQYFNFYSSGEEVLAVHDLPGYPDLFDIGIVNNTGQYSWALQEKLKGRMTVPGILGSMYGGWGFNLSDQDYYIEVPLDGGGTEKQPKPALSANALDPFQLRTRPFFKKQTSDNDLFQEASGSSYAEANRVRLLAEAFPARTLATGRQQVNALFTNGDNFDMQLNFENGWPVERGNDHSWLHSDIREVSYLYVYRIFDAMNK